VTAIAGAPVGGLVLKSLRSKVAATLKFALALFLPRQASAQAACAYIDFDKAERVKQLISLSAMIHSEMY